MISLPENTLSFIIRVWVEPREIKDAPVIWRGVVEVVGGPTANRGEQNAGRPGMRMAFHTLDELKEFLDEHLKALGVPPDEKPA